MTDTKGAARRHGAPVVWVDPSKLHFLGVCIPLLFWGHGIGGESIFLFQGMELGGSPYSIYQPTHIHKSLCLPAETVTGTDRLRGSCRTATPRATRPRTVRG